MKRKLNLGVVLFLGLSVSMLLAATYQSLMISGSGVCSQFVNLNAGAQLYSVNIATESYVQEHSGMWELVERWEPGSAATSYTFSGLNGNVDRKYLLICRFVVGVDATEIMFRPNNDSTGADYRRRYSIYGGSTTTDQPTGFSAGASAKASDLAFGQVIIDAKSGTYRTAWYCGANGADASALDEIATSFTVWYNNSDNITSIVAVASQANGFAVGTCVELWKLSQ